MITRSKRLIDIDKDPSPWSTLAWVIAILVIATLGLLAAVVGAVGEETPVPSSSVQETGK